jgi:hypothetical protein
MQDAEFQPLLAVTATPALAASLEAGEPRSEER